MKIRNWILLLVFLLAGCRENSIHIGEEATSTPLPTPLVSITRPPDAQATAQQFLEAWQKEDFVGMYNLLTQVSRDAKNQDDFAKLYDDAILQLTMDSMNFEILSTLTNPSASQVAYKVTFKTALFGDISRDMQMNLALEEGQWKVQWDDGMILPELKGGNHLALDYTIPTRGNIYDRNDNALAADTEAVALGVVPGNIGYNQFGKVDTYLSVLTGLTVQRVQQLYSNAAPLWYVAVGTTTKQEVDERYTQLSELSGLVMNNYTARYYFESGIAPHVTGYVLAISAEDLAEYKRKGYNGSEQVGAAGLEKWGEDYLSGKHGASLYVIDPNGQVVTRLAQTESEPAASIITTIDKDFQVEMQNAISGFKGAIVVLERDTGRVLAMASSPGFDPNLFEPANYNSSYQLPDIFGSEDKPLVNRATQGGYPLGSVFKIITMAAALESGIYTKDSIYNCQHEFRELPDQVFYDWTYTKEVAPSGELTLPEGLMRSCNPWFWHIGLDLYRQNRPNDVANMARAFGLGKATGIGQVPEDIGAIPDPSNEGDAVQLAIGQGTMLVTPLQVANFIAALGNGGTLYRPQVVEEVVSTDGQQLMTFEPEVIGTLPISAENMQIIREAMFSVVNNRRGTAYRPFLGVSEDIPIYGKTGTAQNPFGDAHAWFAGYTDARLEDKPDIAAVVIAENGGEGSETGAPIFRRIMEVYFNGRPIMLYPWESKLNVTVTPTLEPTETLIPSLTPTFDPNATETPEP
jgi:penicillin-binding protein 2